MSEDKKWYVSLGDGTFVEMDERPYVFLATDEQIDHFDTAHGGGAPIDCMSAELMREIEAHIHIKDLVMDSHWADHSNVFEDKGMMHHE